MRSMLTAVVVCLILTGGATAVAAPRPAAAAYSPRQVINALYLSLRPRTPAHADHRSERHPRSGKAPIHAGHRPNTPGLHLHHRAVQPSAPAVPGITPANEEMLELI